MMKRKMFLSSVIISVATFNLLVSAGPILDVIPQTYDFGRKAKNEGPYSFEVMVKNAGDAPLIIQSIKPGCGCTEVTMAKQELAPGESCPLKGQLKTAAFEGPQQKNIILSSNDEKAKMKMVSLKIMLPFSQTGIRLYPKGGYYPVRQTGAALRAFAWVENCNAEGAVTIQEIKLPDGWTCEAKLPLAIKAENKANLILMHPLDSVQPVEEFKDLEFTVVTDQKENGELKGKLHYYKKPPVAAVKTVVPTVPVKAKPEPAVAAPAVTPVPGKKEIDPGTAAKP